MKRSLGFAFGNLDETPTEVPPADLYLDFDIPSLYHSWSWAFMEQDANKINAIRQAAMRKSGCSPEVQQLLALSGQLDLIGFFQLLFGMSFEDLSSAQKGTIIASSSCAPLRLLFDFRHVPIDMETFKLIAQKPDNFTSADDFSFILSNLSLPLSHEHVLEVMAVNCPDNFLWLCLPNLELGIISVIAGLVEFVEDSDIAFARLRGYPEAVVNKLLGKRLV